MKMLLACVKWGVLLAAAFLAVVWVDYVLTRTRLVNDQDECAALAHRALPAAQPDDPALRKVFADCMRPRNWSERLMFGDWPLGRQAWKE